MHRHHRHRESASARRYQIGHPLTRIALGSTVAIAVLSAGFYVFVPFSDLSAQQLAAGPKATGTGNTPAPIVLARTGRSWGATAKERQAAAASAPIAKVARSDDARGP